MATPNVGILTNAGKALIDQVNAGQTKITFSKIVFSSMDNNQLTDDQIKALKAVAPQEIVVNNPEVTLDNNTGETRIRATGNNEALTDGVYVKTYAVYAKDDSGNEILYGITVSPNPNYLPEYDGVTPQAVTYSYKVNISNTSNITFTNSNDIYVSDTDLAEALQPYVKTVDVNQQLDKKVTDNKDGSIVVNGKTFVPADDSTVIHNNTLNRIVTDNSGIIIGNDADFGLIKRNGHKGGLAIGSGNSFHFMATGDSTLSNTSLYHEVWNISSDGKVSILGGTSFTPADDSKVVHAADMVNSDVYGLQIIGSGSANNLPKGTVFCTNSVTDLPNESDAWTIRTTYTDIWGARRTQIAIADSADLMFYRTCQSGTSGNYEDWKQLLTADQLPSDIARTSQPANFTAGLQSNSSPVITQAQWAIEDSDSDAQTASANDASGFYYTEVSE